MAIEITVNRSPITISNPDTPVTVSPEVQNLSIETGGGGVTVTQEEVNLTIVRGVPGPEGPQGPAGAAAFTLSLVAAETLSPRDMIGINASGQMVKADADSGFCVGYVADAVTSGATGTAYLISGIVTGFTGLTPGAIYYLSQTAGAITATKPASGRVQMLGVAASTTSLIFNISPAIKL